MGKIVIRLLIILHVIFLHSSCNEKERWSDEAKIEYRIYKLMEKEEHKYYRGVWRKLYYMTFIHFDSGIYKVSRSKLQIPNLFYIDCKYYDTLRDWYVYKKENKYLIIMGPQGIWRNSAHTNNGSSYYYSANIDLNNFNILLKDNSINDPDRIRELYLAILFSYDHNDDDYTYSIIKNRYDLNKNFIDFKNRIISKHLSLKYSDICSSEIDFTAQSSVIVWYRTLGFFACVDVIKFDFFISGSKLNKVSETTLCKKCYE